MWFVQLIPLMPLFYTNVRHGKNISIAAMAVGSAMDITADEYTAQLTAKFNAATMPPH
jgi:hypothetical protein